jgi:hypothetical protein
MSGRKMTHTGRERSAVTDVLIASAGTVLLLNRALTFTMIGGGAEGCKSSALMAYAGTHSTITQHQLLSNPFLTCSIYLSTASADLSLLHTSTELQEHQGMHKQQQH